MYLNDREDYESGADTDKKNEPRLFHNCLPECVHCIYGDTIECVTAIVAVTVTTALFIVAYLYCFNCLYGVLAICAVFCWTVRAMNILLWITICVIAIHFLSIYLWNQVGQL